MIRDVAIIGTGMTPVGEHWGMSLRELAADAIKATLKDANVQAVDAMYVGNAFGSVFSSQSHLGALIADYAGLRGIEAYCTEAADASGAIALRTAYLAVASGLVETALVVGVEKSTDSIAGGRVEARNVGLDADYEAIHGATLPAMAALLMQRYMYEYDVNVTDFEEFTINAHTNGKLNPNAMYRNMVRPGAFVKAPMIAAPINLFDGAPDGDGAAAVVLTSTERAVDLVSDPIRIIGSSVATDTFKLQDRKDMLHFRAVEISYNKAIKQARIARDDIDVIELHDSFTIVSALTLEAMGYAIRGEGWKLVDQIGRNGRLPISTFGGLKSRGNPVGATGVYQAVEMVLQLRGMAGENQINNVHTTLIQNLGGLASTVVTHVFSL